NRIKEQPLDLFSDRTSCHAWWPNQFRLLLASFAYVLVESLRRVGLAGSELARAQAGTIRLQAAQHRGGGGAQHPPGAAMVELGVSLAGALRPWRGLLRRLKPGGAGPGTR
ncbi:MAG: transposase, partial [Verrucomicrobia bacterium]|nr:transposase [Verrucomicrobiota bacterium]